MTSFSWKHNRRVWNKRVFEKQKSLFEEEKNSVYVQEARGVRDRLTLSALCRLLCVHGLCVFASALPPFFIWIASTLFLLLFFPLLDSCVFSMSCFVSLFELLMCCWERFLSVSDSLTSLPDDCFLLCLLTHTYVMIFSLVLCMWLHTAVWLCALYETV